MKAKLKNYRQTPRKTRLIADLIKGKSVPRALTILSHAEKRAADPIRKLLLSAVSNAKESLGVEKENLEVKDVRVDKGVVLKRYRPRARGAAYTVRKRMSNVSLELHTTSAPTSKEATAKDTKNIKS